MKNFYGNYLGLCINNADPEQRGRVQIFIPHIMPALYDRWNKAGTDRKIEIIGNNLQDALPQEDVEQLKKMLPWAEAASPIFGNSVAGHYNPQSGNFNQAYGTESEAAAATGGQFSDINLNDNLTKFAMSIGARETGFSASEASTDRYNQASNNSNVRNAVAGGMSLSDAQAKYGDYGYFQTNQADVDDAIRRGVPASIAQAMNNGGGRGNYSAAQQTTAVVEYIKVLNPSAAAAASKGDWTTANSLLNGKWPSLPGGKSYRSGNEAAAQKFLTGSKSLPTASLTDPAAGSLPGSSNPAQSSPFLDPQPKTYTSITPDQQAILDAAANTVASQGQLPGTLPGSGVATGGGGGGGSAFNWRNSVATSPYSVGNDGVLRTSSGTTACLNGTVNSAGYITGNKGWFGSTGINSANDVSQVNTKLTSPASSGPGAGKVLYGNLGVVQGTNYQPQQGDIAIHQVGAGIHGHAQIYLDGNWHSYKTGDNSFDAYVGKDGQQTTVFRLTPDGQAAVQQTGLCNTDYLGVPYAGPIGSTTVVADQNGIEKLPGMHQTTTSTQPTVTDTTGMPQGLFSVPNPGAMLWVFFREGDPLFPVYFAASYGAREWNNAYKGASPKAHYPNEGDTTPRNQAIFRPNQAGGLTFTDTITDEEDARSIRMFHANGAHLEMHLNGSTFYSPNEHIQQVAGNHFNSCLNRETWTQGTSNSVTIGDRITIVGNISDEAMGIINEHAQIVKDINKNMLKGGGSTA